MRQHDSQPNSDPPLDCGKCAHKRHRSQRSRDVSMSASLRDKSVNQSDKMEGNLGKNTATSGSIEDEIPADLFFDYSSSSSSSSSLSSSSSSLSAFFSSVALNSPVVSYEMPEKTKQDFGSLLLKFLAAMVIFMNVIILFFDVLIYQAAAIPNSWPTTTTTLPTAFGTAACDPFLNYLFHHALFCCAFILISCLSYIISLRTAPFFLLEGILLWLYSLKIAVFHLFSSSGSECFALRQHVYNMTFADIILVNIFFFLPFMFVFFQYIFFLISNCCCANPSKKTERILGYLHGLVAGEKEPFYYSRACNYYSQLDDITVKKHGD